MKGFGDDDEPEITAAMHKLAQVLEERGHKLIEVRAVGIRPSKTVETSVGPVTVNFVERFVPLLSDDEIEYMKQQWRPR